jgi:hypothetical protein
VAWRGAGVANGLSTVLAHIDFTAMQPYNSGVGGRSYDPFIRY